MAASAPSSSSRLTTIFRSVAAHIEWRDKTSKPRAPCNLPALDLPSTRLSLSVNKELRAASFKIRVSIDLEDTPYEETDHLYISICPQDVILLLQDPEHHPESTRTTLRGPTTCFRLVLDRRIPILAPSDVRLPPKSWRNSPFWRSLDSLAQQTVLTIHIDQRDISDSKAVQEVCRAFSNGSIKQESRASVHSLYQGRGATELEFSTCSAEEAERSEDTDDTQAATPPPYPAARPPPYPAVPPPSIFASQPPPRKRQRRSAEAVAGPLDSLKICAEFLQKQQAQMGELLAQQAAIREALACIGDRVQGREGCIIQQPDKIEGQLTKRVAEDSVGAAAREAAACIGGRVQDMEGGIAKRLDKTQEYDQLIKKLVRDSTVDLENELLDYVERDLERTKEELKDELREDCIDALKSDLEHGVVSIILPR